MRLAADTIDRLPADVSRPAYNRKQDFGIVHFGLGAFHRAHQASYTDDCLADGAQGWMTSGVSLRSDAVAAQLNPQDGLYTLVERASDGERRKVIGAVGEALVAGRDDAAVIARIASPACRIVSFTVTEKGYCRAADGSLDLGLARTGFYPLLEQAFIARRAAGLPGLTLLSCDNLSSNGKQLRELLRAWLAQGAPEAATYFQAHCTTPDSMVDRIVPASTEADRAALEAAIRLRDEGAVFTEAFGQWVIEDAFAGPRPAWETHGAIIVADVAPFETAKLRLLNGAHSLLAYAGLDRGHVYVHQAIGDRQLLELVRDLMKEAAATIEPGEGQDLAQYADSLIARFANSALNHRLDQIAMDGSQKIPQRWLDTLAIRQARGQSSPAILTGIAHWLLHVRGDRRLVDDPLADKLKAVWKQAGPSQIAKRVFAAAGLLRSPWEPDEKAVQAIVKGLRAL